MKIKALWIEAEQWAPGEWTPKDDNTDLIVTIDEESRWVASFFSYRNIASLTDKNQRTGVIRRGLPSIFRGAYKG